MCPYEMVAKRGTYKGTDVCVLSGVPCLINDPKDRLGCDRLRQVRLYQERHATESYEHITHIVERTEQGKLL